MSAILFCLYIRDVLAQVSAQATVQVDGFFDDINVSGEPVEVMKAFTVLQRVLPEVGLDFNTSKSSFAYFHEADAPLVRSIRSTLAEHDIQVHTDWLGVVGAVVGAMKTPSVQAWRPHWLSMAAQLRSFDGCSSTR